MKEQFHYAAGYYPLMQDRGDWRRDLELMKETGIQWIRTAELFNTWDQIEPEEGRLEFGFLDEFFDLCAEYGLKILLGTGTVSPPLWIHEKYPDVNIMNNHGERYPNNVSYSWACMDHPGFLKESERYIRTLVGRYKDHPALGAYQIHNEIGFPFMPLQPGGVDLYCYCDHSKEAFRNYLEEKYKTIEALNHAYRWGATNTVVQSFEQVEPPKTKPTSWSSITRWLDWRLFWMDNTVNFVDWQAKTIKELDAIHPTSTNIFFLKSQDPMGVLTGLDQHQMAKVVDYIGYDLYPGSGNKLEKMPEFSSMFLDLARSTVLDKKGRFWMMETDSGPINGWVLGPSRNVKGFDLKRNVFDAIGHGATMSLYQGWREWDFQPIHWGAIVDLDGQPTERTEAAGWIGKTIQNIPEIGNATVHPRKIAVVISRENAIVLNGMGQEKFLIEALRGTYRGLWEQSFGVDFLTTDQVEDGLAENYQMVVTPFLAVLPDKTGRALSKYVENGGLLVGSSRLGMLTKQGWYQHVIPGSGLHETFGVKAFDSYSGNNPLLTYEGKNYQGAWHQDEIQILKEDVEVLARFADESPAITKREVGKGAAVFVGTHPGNAVLQGSQIFWDLIRDLCREYEIEPEVRVSYTNRQNREIDVHRLEEGETTLLVATAYASENKSSRSGKRVEMILPDFADVENCQDAVTGEKLETKATKRGVKIVIRVSSHEPRIIRLKGVGK